METLNVLEQSGFQQELQLLHQSLVTVVKVQEYFDEMLHKLSGT